MMANKQSGTIQPAVLLFDGHCCMCHAITRFVLARDRDARFRFASLQSEAGRQLLREGGLPLEDPDTFVMIENGRYYTKADAALRVFLKMGGLWPLLYGLRVFPVFARNGIYDRIAGRRYRWFGRYDSCPLPTEEMKGRFLPNGTQEVGSP